MPPVPRRIEDLVHVLPRYTRGGPGRDPVDSGGMPAVFDAAPRFALQESHVAYLLRDAAHVRRVLGHALHGREEDLLPCDLFLYAVYVQVVLVYYLEYEASLLLSDHKIVAQ